MDGNHVDAVLAKGLQNRSDFAFEHGYIASDRSVLVGTYESGPGVEAHPRIDGRAVFLHVEVVPSHGNLVNRARLLAFMSHDLRDLGCVQGCGRTTASWSDAGRWRMADQIQAGFYALGKICRFSHPVNVHKINARVIPT